MKELEIKNFKSIAQLKMVSLPNLVVIAGPNGCGKTAIFDAIRVFKAAIGPYGNSELYSIKSNDFKSDLKNVVKINANFAEIGLVIELSSEEKIYLSQLSEKFKIELLKNNGLLTATIRIGKSGEIKNIITSELLTEIFGHYDPNDKIGLFEYIPSHRELPISRNSIADLLIANDEESLERIAKSQQKFHKLKNYLVTMFVFDKLSLSDEASQFLPRIKEFFKDFFEPKEFDGVTVDKAFQWHFPVKTPCGVHEIDFLSSGEKEILMCYANILKNKLFGSIILFDEPDVHLNAALERKVLHYLKKMAEEGNQIWATTHSLEIIGSIPLENLYKLNVDDESGNNQIELCSRKKSRFETLKLLGASTGIQLISDKIIFVEGPTDKEFFENLFEDHLDRVSFVKTEGVKANNNLSQVVTALLDQVAQYDSFYMIRDRDLLSDEKVSDIYKKYGEKVLVLSRRTMENYLLDSQIIFKVFTALGVKSISSPDELDKILKNIADSLKMEVIASLVGLEINRRLLSNSFNFPAIGKSLQQLEDAVVTFGETKKGRLSEQLDRKSLQELVEEKEIVVNSLWEKDWLKLCDGKLVLKELINKIVTPEKRTLNIEALRSLIINQLKNDKVVPDEIANFVKKAVACK
ncbi:MAG: AAA family ATPase [Candidatus Bathyarchaeota archaeon]|nr:AAA family ATPase [Candidatus Bathyarchaeota archaeon]